MDTTTTGFPVPHSTNPHADSGSSSAFIGGVRSSNSAVPMGQVTSAWNVASLNGLSAA